MKRSIAFHLIVLFLFGSGLYAGSYYHDAPSVVFQGENLHIELKEMGAIPDYTAPVLYYRMTGEFDFHAVPLQNQGFIYQADIPAKQLRPGRVQYYFAMESSPGQYSTLPAGAPYAALYEVEVIANGAQGNPGHLRKIDVNILAPQEDEVLNPDDVFISFSIPMEIQNPDELKYRFTLDGIDRTARLVREGHVLTYVPSSMRSGLHMVNFKVYNQDGILIGQKDLRFRVTDRPSNHQAFSYKGSFFVDNRVQSINQNSLNYTRGGLNLNFSYKKFDLKTRFLLNSNESPERQPLNVYSAKLRYNFSYRYFLYLWGGDVMPDYGPLTLQGRRIRGGSIGLYTRFFNLDITKGQSVRGVEGLPPADTTSTFPQRYGTYKQNFFSVRPEFVFGRHFRWALNLISAKDDPHSIQYGPNPKQYLVAGTSLHLNFDNQRIVVRGSAQASILNQDISQTIEFDTLASILKLNDSDRKKAERIVNVLGNLDLLTISPGLAPLPSLALQFDTQLNYFNQLLRVSYKRIDANYKTPGNPYMLRDLKGVFVNDYLRLLQNRIFMNLFFNAYQSNLSQGKASTTNKDFGATFSLTPNKSLPSITLSYMNFGRKNNVAPDDTLFYPEDNVTQSIGLSGSYNFDLGVIRNTVSLSANHFLRDDAYKATKTEYNLLSLGLRNRFSIPLTTRFTYSKSATDFGTNLSTSSTDIQRYSFGLEYTFRHFLFNSELRPFINGAIQKINSSQQASAYQRQNYTVGFSWRTARLGSIDFRYDYISYLFDVSQRSDVILSTRYNLYF